MGALNNHYCDACAAEMRIVNHRVRLVEVSLAPDAITIDAELCSGCYSRLYDWLRGRKDVAMGKWAIPEPIVEPIADDPIAEQDPVA